MSAPLALVRSFTQLRTNPLRTLLTLLGMVFGVGSVVAMMSIGEGAQREILQNIEAMGAANLHIQARPVPDAELGDTVNDSVGLARADLQTLQELVPGVQEIAYRKKLPLNVTSLNLPTPRLAPFAVSHNLTRVHGLPIAHGRPLLQSDFTFQRRVVLLGHDLARDAFKDPAAALGQRLRIEYAWFEVVGVLAPRTALGGDLPIDPRIYNDALLIPFDTAAAELHPPPAYGELDLLSLRVPTTQDTLPAKRAATPVLRALHGGVEDFEAVAPEEILQQRQATQALLNLVLIAIAAISLLVGGIGVMNIMLANIMERIHEIGLRRAVGARRSDIRNQFLLEATLLCVIGGLLGILLGNAASFTVAAIIDLPIAFAWESMLIAFAISATVGVIFGLVPALRAARINPIQALQGE